MKKALLISEIFPPIHGGSGRWFMELYSRLPRNEVVIAAGARDGAESFDTSHDLNVVRTPLSSWSWGLKSLAGLKFYFNGYRHLKKTVKQQHIDVVHCGRCLPEGVFGYLFNKLHNIPYLCYIHGEDIETASLSRELSFIVKHVLKNATTLIANSNNTRQILLDHWHTDPAKTVILNPGFDASRFVPAEYNLAVRQQLGWNERPVILTVGRLQKRKGQDMMIKALPAIKEHFPEVLYAIIGDGEELPTLQALTEELKLQNNVLFMSELSDEQMIQCYQQCSLFILPNRTEGKDIEGFGMVLIEAQGCGKTVIAGDSGGTAETLLEGETGFVIDCTQPENISSKLIDLLGQPETLQAMGQQGVTHAAQFDWQEHTEKAKQLFESV